MSTENNQLKPGDQRPKRGGWAPGNYFCRCNICEDMFTGDKRAIWCADCAYAAPDEELVTPAPNPASDTAREAAATILECGIDREAVTIAAKEIQTAIDDSTAALRREVEELRAERDKSSAMLAANGRVLNISKDALALANKQRDAALQQVAELTRERDEVLDRLDAAVAQRERWETSWHADTALLRQQLTAALARAEAGEKDTARLDWLNKQSRERSNYGLLYVPLNIKGHDLRTAIDAATGGTK